MGAHQLPVPSQVNDYGVGIQGPSMDGIMDLPEPKTDYSVQEETGSVSGWLEMWDYVGGNRFRGFVAEQPTERAMFVFFDESHAEGDLKSG